MNESKHFALLFTVKEDKKEKPKIEIRQINTAVIQTADLVLGLCFALHCIHQIKTLQSHLPYILQTLTYYIYLIIYYI
ncbi:hypothetical protein QVD17_26138 [Tagetes erecta]|uniref:Uncharacterized protein n=1 Tax=Tagetes erecta TaxID=13708 RepID=A0AAD8NQI9_TARER|nr:hypothetical protein QVD17_26138 [Tagetes erecta]